MFDAADFALFGDALPPIAREFGLNPAQAGLLATVGLVGAIVWLRNSLTRYMRYWIIRLVYEQREQTDRLLDQERKSHSSMT